MKYCYLNRIYDVNGVTKYYEVVLSDECFLNPVVRTIGLEELIRFSDDPMITTDFRIEDGILRSYSSEISRSELTSSVNKDEDLPVFINDVFTLYDLLSLGVQNDFCVMDKALLDFDEHTGNGFTNFRNIKFSKSSMTIYVRMIKDNEIYNINLAKIHQGVVHTEPFFFLVPDDFVGEIPNCSFMKKIVVNNRKYSIYVSGVSMLFVPVSAITPPLINKACCLSVAVQSAIKAFQTLKNVITSQTGESTKLNWVGGNSRGPKAAVLFENSNSVIKDPDSIVVDIIKMCGSCETLDEVLQCISEKGDTVTYQFIEKNLATVIKNSTNLAEEFDNVNLYLQLFNKTQFWADMFAHKIRMSSFLSGKSLISPIHPYFTGSEMAGFTLVRKEY